MSIKRRDRKGRVKGIPLKLRFWRKVDKKGPRAPHMTSNCWLWTGRKFSNGYGSVALYDNRRRHGGLAHRISRSLTTGPIPDGAVVMHRCDVRACVRPGHLVVGTQKDNLADMRAKGRQPKGLRLGHPGETNPAARLTVAQVAEIRRRYAPRRATRIALAEEYGVSEPLIDKIVSGKIWRYPAAGFLGEIST